MTLRGSFISYQPTMSSNEEEVVSFEENNMYHDEAIKQDSLGKDNRQYKNVDQPLSTSRKQNKSSYNDSSRNNNDYRQRNGKDDNRNGNISNQQQNHNRNRQHFSSDPTDFTFEDPRLRENPEKKIKKSKGQGRNTESFDPRSTLIRPDMRVIVGRKDDCKWRGGIGTTPLKHDDVVVVPDFICDEDDWSIYNALVHEMRESQSKGTKQSEWISWHEGAHLISKNPSGCKTFRIIQEKIAKYFNIPNQSVGTRFNWYRDSADWKPFHHDSAAFNPERGIFEFSF